MITSPSLPRSAEQSEDPIVEANRQLLLHRSRLGIRKYGVTLDASSLSQSQYAQHALEEALDLANYLQGFIQHAQTAAASRVELPAGELHIGVSNNDLGVHVTILLTQADGSTTLIYSAKAPTGDSFGRATLAGLQEVSESPSQKQEKLRALADRLDHEKLWKRPMIYRDRLTDDQRDRLDAGCMLRRYADLLAPGRWLVVPPTGNVQFSAGSLEKVTEMATQDQARRATQRAQNSAVGGGEA